MGPGLTIRLMVWQMSGASRLALGDSVLLEDLTPCGRCRCGCRWWDAGPGRRLTTQPTKSVIAGITVLGASSISQ